MRKNQRIKDKKRIQKQIEKTVKDLIGMRKKRLLKLRSR